MKPAYFLLLVLLSFSACKKKDPPAPTGSIHVYVCQSNSKAPLSGYTVKITSYPGLSVVQSLTTSSNGMVDFNNLKIDKYGVELDSSNGSGLYSVNGRYDLSSNSNVKDTLNPY